MPCSLAKGFVNPTPAVGVRFSQPLRGMSRIERTLVKSDSQLRAVGEKVTSRRWILIFPLSVVDGRGGGGSAERTKRARDHCQDCSFLGKKRRGEGSAQTTNLPSAFLVASLLPSSWPRDVIIEDSEPERPGNWLFRQSDRRSNAAFTEGKFSLLHCVFSDGQKYVKCSENRLF